MKISKVNGKFIACFSRAELIRLHRFSMKQEFLKEMRQQNLTLADIESPSEAITKLVQEKAKKDAEYGNFHEILLSLYIFLDFYQGNSKVCFELTDRFNPSKDKIDTIENLQKFRTIDTDSDFIIESNDGMRNFQLKRYRGNLTTNDILAFIKQQLDHYGGDLGKMNLLIVLQPSDPNSMIGFEALHKKLKTSGLSFRGHILISFNSSNKKDILIQVYPDLGKKVIPHLRASTK